MKLAFHVSELTFLQAKQQIIEESLQIASQRNESHAVIEVCFSKTLNLHHPSCPCPSFLQHLSDDLNHVQTEMMNKISEVQELKLALNSLRADQGSELNNDLEQVTIELKLDEVVRQHIIKLKQQSISEPQEFDVANELTFEQALTEAVSLAGMKMKFCVFFSLSSSLLLFTFLFCPCLYSKQPWIIDFFRCRFDV